MVFSVRINIFLCQDFNKRGYLEEKYVTISNNRSPRIPSYPRLRRRCLKYESEWQQILYQPTIKND